VSVAMRSECLIRFRGGGVESLRSLRFGPRKRKLDAAGFALLRQAIQQTPRAVRPDQEEFDRSLWTLELLASYLRQAVGVEVAIDTVRRYLLLLGWTTRAPKLTCRSPDPEYSTKMAAIGELRAAAEKGGLRRRSSCTPTRPS